MHSGKDWCTVLMSSCAYTGTCVTAPLLLMPECVCWCAVLGEAAAAAAGTQGGAGHTHTHKEGGGHKCSSAEVAACEAKVMLFVDHGFPALPACVHRHSVVRTQPALP